MGREQAENRISKEGKYIHPYQFIGQIDSTDGEKCFLNPKNRISLDDEIEIIGPDRSKDRKVKILKIYRGQDEVNVLNPNQNGEIIFNGKIFKGEMLRKITPVKERKQVL